MIGHDRIWEHLPDAAAGTFPPEEQEELERHLEECPACRRELEALRRAVGALTGAPAPLDPPAALRARVLAQTTSRRSPAAAMSRPPTPLRQPATLGERASGMRVLAVASAAAIAAIIAIVAIVLTQRGEGLAPRDRYALQPIGRSLRDVDAVAVVGKERDGNLPLELRVGGLPATAGDSYYQIWLGGKGGRYAVSRFAVEGQDGVKVRADMPAEAWRHHSWIWVSRESDGEDPEPGVDVLKVKFRT